MSLATKFTFLFTTIFFMILMGIIPSTLVQSAPHQRTLRLCSKSLSDALYLVCSDRGYNEPFSSNGDEDTRVSAGPGIVEECCHRWCSYAQLEQYCKPPSSN